MTGENLVYKLRVVEKAKFEYYSLSKVFNKGLKEENKEEGLLQRWKNIENKNKEQLKEIEYQGEKQLSISISKEKTFRSN